ncbi:MAG: hypothetical protein A2103_04375 [Gammaproteobacteria bacterium GWF2_41_13]|nr:MAG: hypothetical protein A2103_04375 [Gammaproteobacteria bacterium GWF2_41_13]
MLYHNGKIDVLDLRGSYREMGKQYGRLERKKLHDFYHDITLLFIVKNKVSVSSLNQIAETIFATYPYRFKEIFYGLSETSGLTLHQLLIINAFEHYMFNDQMNGLDTTSTKCSAIAVWPPYTKNSTLLFGRNYDFVTDIDRFKKYLTITVFHPQDAGHATAIVTFVGTLNATTEINSKKLFLELNSGGGSTQARVYNRISTPIELLAMLIDSDNLQQLDEELHTINTNTAFIINIANPQRAISYEWSIATVKKVENKTPGLLVSSNHFIHPSWYRPMPESDHYLTLTRRKNLLALAKQFKGQIDLSRMKAILDTPLQKGGATSYQAKKGMVYTAFQVIAIPESDTLWIKIPAYQNWTKLNLSSLL